jgi:RNase P protein component
VIYSRRRLREVLDEISEWNLDRRRQYIADIEKEFGSKSAQQLKDGLTELWKRKKHECISCDRPGHS